MRKKPPSTVNNKEKQWKKLDLETLILWAEQGIITLMYLDESGCCCESPLVYSYGEKGKQKQIEQNRRKGRRINLIGVWEPNQKMEYSMVASSIKTQTYLSFMEQQVKKAASRLFNTGKLTVIVHDNASIHRSKKAKEEQAKWEKWGLLTFFLPKYSPEMNRIEEQWLHLKRDELQGRVYEDEYDLVIGIIEGMNHRAEQNNYTVERLMFN